MECAEVVPIYKKNDQKYKSNYRPISLISNISKIYERCIQEQLDKHFSDLLSKYRCDFRHGYGTQNCPLAMIEKLRKIRDKKGSFAAVLTDLSKAFDCIPHNPLIARLSAYGFGRKSLIFISAYLKIRKQKTRIGSAFSDYLNILFGVPQGSILGPILFMIFLSDLFYIYNDFDYARYADGTTPYVCKENYAEANEFLEPTFNNIFAWFNNNGLVANSGKSNSLVSPYEKISLKILGFTVEFSPCELLLGITIDSEVTSQKHIISLCSNARNLVPLQE